MNARIAGVVVGALALAAVIGIAATASADEPKQPVGPPAPEGPTPQDCKQLKLSLVQLKNVRAELEHDAELAAEAGDEEALQQIANAIYNVNANIANVNASLKECPE